MTVVQRRGGVPTRHTHKWGGLVCRPSHPCVCRVGTPPASTNARKGLPLLYARASQFAVPLAIACTIAAARGLVQPVTCELWCVSGIASHVPVSAFVC